MTRTVLKHHLANAPAHAKYTSTSIQNSIADILGCQVKQAILNRVKRAQFFSLIADEVTDSSNKEQLAIVLRYVDPDDLHIREDLVEFVECDAGVTGRAVATKITGCIESSGLDLTKIRGQAYDGAGNMAGKVKGAAAIITSQDIATISKHIEEMDEELKKSNEELFSVQQATTNVQQLRTRHQQLTTQLFSERGSKLLSVDTVIVYFGN